MARSSRMAGGCSAPTEGNVPIRAREAHNRDVAGVRRSMIAMCTTGAAAASPHKSEQRRAAGGDFVRGVAPSLRRHDEARPWPVAVDWVALRDDVGERRHRPNPSSPATFWNQATSAGGM